MCVKMVLEWELQQCLDDGKSNPQHSSFVVYRKIIHPLESVYHDTVYRGYHGLQNISWTMSQPKGTSKSVHLI